MVQTGGKADTLSFGSVYFFFTYGCLEQERDNARERETETTVAEQSRAKCNRIFDRLIKSNQHDCQIMDDHDFNRITEYLHLICNLSLFLVKK